MTMILIILALDFPVSLPTATTRLFCFFISDIFALHMSSAYVTKDVSARLLGIYYYFPVGGKNNGDDRK